VKVVVPEAKKPQEVPDWNTASVSMIFTCSEDFTFGIFVAKEIDFAENKDLVNNSLSLAFT
jgi:hypothetical protein